jgi:hypothetical protein
MSGRRDPETLAIDQMVEDALARARQPDNPEQSGEIHERDTMPDIETEIEDYEVPDTRTVRERIADWLESVGRAVATEYWAFVCWVRGVT